MKRKSASKRFFAFSGIFGSVFARIFRDFAEIRLDYLECFKNLFLLTCPWIRPNRKVRSAPKKRCRRSSNRGPTGTPEQIPESKAPPFGTEKTRAQNLKAPEGRTKDHRRVLLGVARILLGVGPLRVFKAKGVFCWAYFSIYANRHFRYLSNYVVAKAT